MAVNATTVFWVDLPPSSASPGQNVVVTARITNTGTQEEDFRLSVQIVGVGAAIFPVPLEVWSSQEELSPTELLTATASFIMPEYGVQLTVQAEWYNRAGAPAQWVKVGSTASRNIAVSGISPQFPVGAPSVPAVAPSPISVQLDLGTILPLVAVAGFLFIALRKK